MKTEILSQWLLSRKTIASNLEGMKRADVYGVLSMVFSYNASWMQYNIIQACDFSGFSLISRFLQISLWLKIFLKEEK